MGGRFRVPNELGKARLLGTVKRPLTVDGRNPACLIQTLYTKRIGMQDFYHED